MRVSSTLDQDVVVTFEAYDPGDDDWNAIDDPGFATVAAALTSLGTYADLAALESAVPAPGEGDIYVAGGLPYIGNASNEFIPYVVTPVEEDQTLIDLAYNNDAAAVRRANRIRVKLDAAADPTTGEVTVIWSYRR